METWLIITIGAAFLQNCRSGLQKHLKNVMGTAGATFVRFGFGIPFAGLYLFLLTKFGGFDIPHINITFIFWVMIAAIAQILGQAALVHMFSLRNFAVGSAYSRTEPAQAALFGLVFLFETLSIGVLFAIAISVLGVMIISVARTDINAKSFLTSLGKKTTLIGLASGACFGIAAVGYRAASLSLGGPNFAVQASVTLVYAIILQSVLLLIWMLIKDRSELVRIKNAWKISLLVGFFGATASFGWFAAMTLQQAAIVKVVAQIEMLFTFATTVFIFKEHINRYEVIGCLLIVAGIIALLVV